MADPTPDTCRAPRRCPIPDDPCGPDGPRAYCWEGDSETPEGVYRAAAEAAIDAAFWDPPLSIEEREHLIARAVQRPGDRAGWDVGYAAGHVDGGVAERGRITRIIRRHANSAGLPLGASNALSRIVDEMEGTDG